MKSLIVPIISSMGISLNLRGFRWRMGVCTDGGEIGCRIEQKGVDM